MPFIPDSNATHSPRFVPDQEADKTKKDGAVGFKSAAMQAVGQGIRGAGQAAADFIPGVSQDNAITRQGDEIIQANPTAVHSLEDIAAQPWTALKEATGNAAGSMGSMIAAKGVGEGIAMLPHPVAKVVGKGISYAGPVVAAGLPSYGGIRQQQIEGDPSRVDDQDAKLRALGGAAAVGAIETRFGPQEWALSAFSKEGRKKLAERFAAQTLPGAVGKGVVQGAAVEGAEELVQNPIEQVAGYQDPTTEASIKDTLFGGAMGALGGGLPGGVMGGASHAMRGGDQGEGEPLPAQDILGGVPNAQPGQASPAMQGNQLPGGGAPAGVGGAGQAGAQPVPGTAPGPATGNGRADPVVPAGKPDPALEALAPRGLTDLDRVSEIDAERARVAGRLAELNDPGNGYGPMFDAERQELVSKADELATERATLARNWPPHTPGLATSFTTESGARIDGQFALMEANDLVASHDENLRRNQAFPAELQPRERDRAASEMQVSSIVHRLDPARLGESADAANGAPIVGADGLVESGNARTIALKRVYQANGQKAEAYRQYLKDNAARFGLTPDQVDGMRRPVLVRVRQTPVDRAEFARQANASTVAQMSSSEQARADAARVDDLDGLNPDENGEFSTGTSRDFIRRFMARLPATEQAGMIDATGGLSQTGYARVRNAVLAKAYGDSPVLLRMVESLDDNTRNLTKALVRVAPRVAQVRQAIAEGRLYDADLIPDLVAAVEEISRLKDSGVSIQDYLAQTGMFQDGVSEETRDLMQFMADNIRRPAKIADFIHAYLDGLEALGNPNQGSLLGESTPPGKGDIMTAARSKTDGQVSDRGATVPEGSEAGAINRGEPGNAAGDQGRDEGNVVKAAQAWVMFGQDSGTLGIPRKDMPQIKGKDRGAFIQFINGKGITHTTQEVATDTLKPTQAEYSTEKAKGWMVVRGDSDRSVLVSSDGYVLDGHHQWMGARMAGEPIKTIRLDAPISVLLSLADEFPSTQRSGEGAHILTLRQKADQDFKNALSDLGSIVRDYAGVARMVPEDTPNLMPTLVKLAEAGILKVGYKTQDLVRYMKDALKGMAEFKTIWNKIADSTYKKAATQAAQNAQAGNGDLFSAATVQQDLFNQPNQGADDGRKVQGQKAAQEVNQQASKAAATKARRNAALAILGDGWKAGDGTEGSRDAYKKRVGPLEVSVMPQKTVDGNFYVGSYYWGGPRKGPGGFQYAQTIEEAARIANEKFGEALKQDAMPDTFTKSDLASQSDNFTPPVIDGFLPSALVKKVRATLEGFEPPKARELTPEEQAKAEALLKPRLKLAEEGKPEYDAAVRKIAKDLGVDKMLAPIKKMGRASQKLVLEENYDIDGMKDLLRGTIVVDKYTQAQAALDAVAKAFDVMRVKDRTGLHLKGEKVQDQGPMDTGYRDVLINVRMPNGSIAEIQINVPEMIGAKEHEGHKLYEMQRPILDMYGKPDYADPAYQKLAKIQGELYNAAAAANEARKDSSLTGEAGPLGTASSLETAPASDTRKTPSGETKNSRPSKVSKNLVPSGNDSGNLFMDQSSTPSMGQRSDNTQETAYTGGEKPAGNADEQHARTGRGQDAGRGAGPVPGTGVGGQPETVPDGTGGRGDQRNGEPVDGDRQEARPGQGNEPGEAGRAVEQRPAGGKGNRSGRTGLPAGRDIPAKSGRNYRFGDDDLTYQGSWIKKAEQNVEAVELLKRLQQENRQATREEQSVLAKFIGWGASDLANNLFGKKLDKQLEILRKYEIASQAMQEAGRDYLAPSGYRMVGYRRVWESGDPNFHEAFAVVQAKNPDLRWSNDIRITREELDKARPSGNVKKWAELRDRLKAVMTEEEWADAEGSTINAHYTSKAIVKAMWRGMERMGFKGGAVLEPGAGIGVFPGLMSAAMATNSSYTGIELDAITGGILKQLFPDERIAVESFVDSALPDEFYDVAAGNPPFANIKILADPRYRKLAPSLHDYFFMKTLDKVKPGGLVMFVTSRYTMDKIDDKARKFLSERADLVGAIRLPQTAFKQNAGTDVVTDVLFLRKKVPGENFEQAQAWGKVAPVTINGREFQVNEYYHAHPEMVLGTHSDKGKMANTPDPQYTVEPIEGDIEALFDKAVDNLPADIYKATGEAATAAQVREIDFNPKVKKEGNYYLSDAGQLMQVDGGVGVRAENIKPKDVALVKAYIPLRDAVKQAQYDQLNDGPWEESLAAMQKAYQAFVKQHGNLLQFTTRRVVTKDTVFNEDTGLEEETSDEVTKYTYPVQNLLADDPDSTLVMALESINEETGVISATPALTERVLLKPTTPRIETPHDALLSVLNDTGEVDLGLIAERLGMDQVDTIAALGTAVYETPSGKWQMADEYLSGNVKKKLAEARKAAESDRRFERNVQALVEAQPSPLTQADINVALGQRWVSPAIIQQFMREVVGVNTEVFYNDRLGGWTVDKGQAGRKKNADTGRMDWATAANERDAAMLDWGTTRAPAHLILEHALNSSPVRIMVWEGSGKDAKEVFSKVETDAAIEKVKKMRDAFQNWVWTDDKRADELVRTYNDKFNVMVARKFDGRHLTMPGSSALIDVFPHVKRGAWRIIQDGNTYLAHAVGSGKTWQMVISAMEQKRLGLVNKPMIVVPNHMLQQFKQEWLQLYPAARLMVADEKQFHTDNRRRFVARAALSDLDGVIITHSAFKLLDLDPEFKRKMIEQELEQLRAALEEEGVDLDEKSRDPKVKEIQKRIKTYEEKLKKLMSGEGKDKSVRFDEMGVDFLYVDEAHEFRKLAFTTTRQVKGISSSGSERAFDLWMKTRWLEQKKPGRNLVMASGTPVTNTMAELYSVQKFMDYATLEEQGLERFDDWAAQYGEESTEIEADAGGAYAPVTRFAKFHNVPELTQAFRQFADVLTSEHLAEMLGDKRPRVQGGSRNLVVTPRTEQYAAFNEQDLIPRLQASRNWKPSPDEPNNPDPIIRIIGDGRLAAIDMRFMEPSLPNDPDSKLNQMIDGVIRVYKETSDWEYKDKKGNIEPVKGGSQMVFSDLGFGEGVANRRGFNARAWFEKRLRDAGIPMAQVAFMSDYKKSVEKVNLFRDVNAGKVRILIGSSKNMGTGVNAQQRLIALHHLDTPWYPADLEQREGRIIRQGNKNPTVHVYAYSTKGSYDQVMWQMLARKQKFIEQALSGDSSVRSLEDVSESSQYAMAVAMTAGDPDAINLAGARADIEKYLRLQRHHEENRVRMRTAYNQAVNLIDVTKRVLPDVEKLAARVQDMAGDNFKAKVMGQEYDSRKEWSQALLDVLKDRAAHGVVGTQAVGEISGFPAQFIGKAYKNGQGMVERFETTLVLPLGDKAAVLALGPDEDLVGMAMRATNALVAVKRQPEEMRQAMADAKSRMTALEARMDAPFEHAQALAEKIKEAEEIEARLVANSQPVAEAQPETPEDGTQLSRNGAHHVSGMAKRDLDATVARVQNALDNLPTVHVFASPADLDVDDPAQKRLRDFIERHGAMNDVEGATHEGDIYLFASGLADESRAEHVLAIHETTHYGLRAVFGKNLDQVLQSIWVNNAKVRNKAQATKEKLGLDSNVAAVEEVLADMDPADLVKLKGWRRLVQVVRNWLHAHGFTSLAGKVSKLLTAGLQDQAKADLMVADVVNGAREWVRNGRTGRAGAVTGTQLANVRKLADDAQAQEKWLNAEARARGYRDIDALAAQDYKVFEKLAKLWREKNPADVMLARAKAREEIASKNGDVWSVGDVPKVGEKFIVYRFGDGSGQLAGRNAGNAWGVVDYIMSQEDLEKPSNGVMGTHVYAYEVEIDKPFGAYEAITRGANQIDIRDGAPVGRVERSGAVAYSFPRGGAWKARTIGHVTLKSLYDDIESRTKDYEFGPYANFDDTGWLLGGDVIRDAFAGMDVNVATETPRLSRAGQKETASERADAIISRPASTPRPIDTAVKAVTQATGLAKLTAAAYDKAGFFLDRFTPETIKAGVVADYGIPEAVLDQRALMQGRMRVQLRKTGELIDKLSTLTREESRIAYMWMNADNPQASDYLMQQLPPESIQTLAEVEKMIDRLSREAVSLGQLDPEAFKRNRYAYLRRSYVKHTAELTQGDVKRRGRTIAILGDQYKGRGMVEGVAMRQIQNVAPEWWGRKFQAGKADKGLKDERFIRLERRAPAGDGTTPIPGIGDRTTGRVLQVAYWPASEPMPAKFKDWNETGTWEVRDTKGDKLIMWRDFTAQERQAMGEIDEARFAVAKTLHGMVHDVEVGRYLEWLAQRHAKKDGAGLNVVKASEKMKDTFAPGEWVEVPDSKIPGTKVLKYGILAGRYLPGPIWNDVRQVTGGKYRPLGDVYAAILSAWKTSKTTLSPTVHTNNVMANLVMADWHDVTAGHIAKALRIMLGASDRKREGALGRVGNMAARAGLVDREAAREIMNRFTDSGGNIGTWATAELQREQLEPMLKALEQELAQSGNSPAAQVGAAAAMQHLLRLQFPSAWQALKPTKGAQAVATEARSMIDLYEAEDQVFRLAAWLRAKEEGADDLAAGKVARKSFLDYHINAPWVQAARQTVLPFVAFTYRAVPMLLETIGKKPWKIMKLGLLAGLVNALGYAMSGGDEDDERKLLPEEKAGSIWGLVPKLIRMPWNDAHGSPVFLDIRRWVPVGDVFDLGQTHAAVPILPAAVPGGPLALIAELFANKSQFTGRAIVQETDTPMEQAGKVLDHIYKAFAPNIIILPGTYAFTAAMNAGTGRTDSFGREQSMTQAVISAHGVKVGAYPADQLRLNAKMQMQARDAEISRNMAGLKRELMRKGISQAEFDDAMAKEIEKRKNLKQEFADKVR